MQQPQLQAAALDTAALDIPARDIPALDIPARDTPARDTPARDTPARDRAAPQAAERRAAAPGAATRAPAARQPATAGDPPPNGQHHAGATVAPDELARLRHQLEGAMRGWRDAHASAMAATEAAQGWRQRATALEASTSWQVSAPLRRAVRALRRDWRAELPRPAIPDLPAAPRGAAPAPPARPEVADLATLCGWLEARLAAGLRSGLTILTCGFDFDLAANQRPIALAREAAAAGHAVVFVAWEWAPPAPGEGKARLVEGDILQVGRFDFTGNPELFERLVRAAERSLCLLSLPSRDLCEATLRLRGAGCTIAYDIMDEWEDFARAGQAPWFEKTLEENLVLAADLVAAVSPPLAAKFARLRRDIAVSPNGFRPRLLGPRPAPRAPWRPGTRLRAGYVGHLTEAWFDWEMLAAALAAMPELELDVIGYGEPEAARRLAAAEPRLRLLGRRHPAELGGLAAGWHAAIIPFRPGPLAAAVDPIKIYEYLWFRLPCVASGIEHLAACPGTRVARGAAGFAAALRAAAAAALPQGAVDAFLAGATWRSRWQELLRLAEARAALAPLFRPASG